MKKDEATLQAECRRLLSLAEAPIKLIIHHNEQTAEIEARNLTSGQVAGYRRRLLEVDSRLGDPEAMGKVSLTEEQTEQVRHIMEDAIHVSTGLTRELLPDVDAIKSTIFEEIILMSSVSEKDLEEISKFRRHQ